MASRCSTAGMRRPALWLVGTTTTSSVRRDPPPGGQLRGSGQLRALQYHRPATLRATLRPTTSWRGRRLRCDSASLPGVKTTYDIVQASESEQTIAKGATVTVHATGVVKSTGEKFWSTKDAGQEPFKYEAGVGGVITGWDQGCLGMRLGEIRKLDIPADEGYGAQGFPAWNIPPNGDLLFEIEVLAISPPDSLPASPAAAPAAATAAAASVSGLDALEGLKGTASLDPEGLFKDVPAESHFARRERERAARLAASAAAAPAGQFEGFPAGAIRKVVPAESAITGLLVADADAFAGQAMSKKEFAQMLKDKYMAVDLDKPGVRVHCLDPPVLSVDGYLGAEECDALMKGAQATNRIVASQVGEGLAGSQAASARRTSSGVLLDNALLESHPDLDKQVTGLQKEIRAFLPGGVWDPRGFLPGPQRYCFESTQVARYTKGQHFLAHEDAFPEDIAANNKFQRTATLLVYLNDVPAGGATRFEHLGFAVTPAQGRALLFFPGKADMSPDPRTLHTAEAAVDEKWITQQWVAAGIPTATAPSSSAASKAGKGKKKGYEKKSKKAKVQSEPARGFGRK